MFKLLEKKRNWINQNLHLKKIIQNASWMFFGRLATMVISFFSTLYIARNLGPTNYGQLSFATSMNGLFAFIAPLGLDSILFRELVRTPEKKEELLGTTLILKLAAGLIASILSIITAFIIKTDFISKILIIILSGTFIFNAFLIINYDFLSRSESKYQSIISMLASFILNLAKIVVIMTGKGVIYLAIILLFEAILNAGLYVFVYQFKLKNNIRSWKWNKKLGFILLRDSLPLMILTAFTNIYTRVDQVIIKYMINVTQVGVYDAAVRISELWSFIPGILITALFPTMVEGDKNGKEVFNKRMKKAIVLFTSVPTAIAIIVSIFSTYIVEILYGGDYIGSVPVLRIYVWSGVFTSLGLFAYHYLVSENLKAILIMSSFLPMVINIILNILWIPSFGISGAAFATLVSYMLIPLTLILFKKTRKSIIEIIHA